MLKNLCFFIFWVQEPVTTVPPSVPVRPEDSVALKCSILHESQNKSCPADDNVFCFTAESNQCHPSFNYTKEDEGNEYEKISTGVTTKKCFYSLLKNFSSSDAWMYHCVVAPCEENGMGNKSKLNTEGNCIIFIYTYLNYIIVCQILDYVDNNRRVTTS